MGAGRHSPFCQGLHCGFVGSHESWGLERDLGRGEEQTRRVLEVTCRSKYSSLFLGDEVRDVVNYRWCLDREIP